MKYFLFVFFLIISTVCIAQVDEILNAIYLEEFDNAKKALFTNNATNAEVSCELKRYYNFAIHGEDNSHCSTGKFDNEIASLLNQLNAAHKYFYIDGNGFKAYLTYKDAVTYARKNISNNFYEKLALKDMLLFFANNYSFAGSDSYTPYLIRFKLLIKEPSDQSFYLIFKLRLQQRFENDISDEVLAITKVAEKHVIKFDQQILLGRLNSYKAYNYINKYKIPDSALHYSRLAMKQLKVLAGIHNKERLNAAYLTAARALVNLDEIESSLKLLDSTPLNLVSGYLHDNLLGYYYYFKWIAFEKKQELDSVNHYKLKFYEHDYKFKIEENTNNIANFDELYKTNELKEKNQRNLIIFIIVGALSIVLFSLIFLNSQRKKKIAEQQREIEIQKTEKLLKEQEITSINAIIEGQEKERQRVASDLHDSVGATLAAAKLQFSHISNNKDKALELGELFDKTEKLLDTAYAEVRGMAHIKNSGVIAKNGLLPAIKKLADNVSVYGNLKVESQDFGLENRLENSLEITIFRIIQELITNIVKHANATEASINITQHEALLSIIIEDNGKGFIVSESINNPNGMGLSSIEKRIEHLEGTLEIDSSIGRGTTILIDLPL